MKIAHRPHVSIWFAVPESDPVDDDYAADVRRDTERSEHSYREAQSRLANAEARLARVCKQRATPSRKKLISKLEALTADRRAEFAELERLMTAPLVTDKQIRLRTGLDDHLELGEYKPPRRRRVTAAPVKRGAA